MLRYVVVPRLIVLSSGPEAPASATIVAIRVVALILGDQGVTIKATVGTTAFLRVRFHQVTTKTHRSVHYNVVVTLARLVITLSARSSRRSGFVGGAARLEIYVERSAIGLLYL